MAVPWWIWLLITFLSVLAWGAVVWVLGTTGC
jgi:hypothetical protein